jgi:hypothetical protein
MTLKSQIQADIPAFFDLDEFAEEHEVNGATVSCIWDQDLSTERSKGDRNMGVYLHQPVLFVPLVSLSKPRIAERMTVDGEYYTVTNVVESEGVLEITLTANQS